MKITIYAFMLLSLLTGHGSSAQNAEVKAIMQVIKTEVDALNRHYDLEEYMSCFAHSDKIQVGPSNDKMTIGYAAVKINAQKVITQYNGRPNPNTWSFANWDIRVNGNTAFTSCLQTTRTDHDTYIRVFKSDYLEKINGKWKIVDHRFFHAAESKE